MDLISILARQNPIRLINKRRIITRKINCPTYFIVWNRKPFDIDKMRYKLSE